MQRFLAALPDADDPRVLYEIRQTQWGGLRLIQLTHDFGPSLYAWMINPKITGTSLCAEYIPTWLEPLLRQMPESLRWIRNHMKCDFLEQAQAQALGCVFTQLSMGMAPLYLDPG
mgnify:CR=1 FL=1